MFLISEFYLFLFIKMLGKMNWRRMIKALNFYKSNLFNKISKN